MNENVIDTRPVAPQNVFDSERLTVWMRENVDGFAGSIEVEQIKGGHPLTDFAYHCMTWRLSPGQFRGLVGVDYAALGIPSEAEYVVAYCNRTGHERIAPVEWEYYMAFNMFRLAGILQGIMARALQGNVSSQEAIETGKRTRPLAEEAWRQVERIVAKH